MTESDELELAKQLERLEKENAEVDGDDDNPDDEEAQEANFDVWRITVCSMLDHHPTYCMGG